MNYKGIIIEESLGDTELLKHVVITKTEVEPVTETNKTPWLTRWTMHSIEIPESDADAFANTLSKCLDVKHKNSWYADFKNNRYHFIIYRDKVFKVDLKKPILYKDATEYGVSMGIPAYQVDFTSSGKQ